VCLAREPPGSCLLLCLVQSSTWCLLPASTETLHGIASCSRHTDFDFHLSVHQVRSAHAYERFRPPQNGQVCLLIATLYFASTHVFRCTTCCNFLAHLTGKSGRLLQLKSKLAEKEAAEADRARDVKDTTTFLLACMQDVKAKIVELEVDTEQKNGDHSMRLLPGASLLPFHGIYMLVIIDQSALPRGMCVFWVSEASGCRKLCTMTCCAELLSIVAKKAVFC
jgi:hypothetical protein